MFRRVQFYQSGPASVARYGYDPKTWDAVSVRDYWPSPWPKDSPTDLDALYNAVIADPFDFAPRGVLADYLDERVPEFVTPALMRSFAGGEWMDPPRYSEFRRWSGPGLVGDPGHLLQACWAGVSYQFVQACREGLFCQFPVTTVILADRHPSHHVSLPSTRAGHSVWLSDRAFPDGSDGASQWVINDVIARFIPEVMVNPLGPSGGVYRAINRRDALFGLSVASVNLGRYAVGLPKLPDSPIIPPERYKRAVEALWHKFRVHYRADQPNRHDWPANRDAMRLEATNRLSFPRKWLARLIAQTSQVRG